MAVAAALLAMNGGCRGSSSGREQSNVEDEPTATPSAYRACEHILKLRLDDGTLSSAGFMIAGCEVEFETEAKLRSREQVDEYLRCAVAAQSPAALEACGEPHPIERDICTRQMEAEQAETQPGRELSPTLRAEEADLCVRLLIGMRINRKSQEAYPVFIECTRAAKRTEDFEACTKTLRDLVL